ncbi:MAG TPA: SGNH/GDSL hydrolase family protein [Bryobacteraceae bacterium]
MDSRPTPTTEYKSLLKSFAIRLCVAATLGVVLLGAVELYSYRRYLPAARDVMEPAVKLDLAEGGTTAEREYWKEFEQANKVTYHQYVLWRRAPYQGKVLSINLDGVRRTLHTECDDKSFTIWMFGDSVMWGAGAPDEETIPSFVARGYERVGREVCIVNYAEKGWANTQEMVGLIEQLKHATRKPDIVLFYDGGTEAFAAYQSGRADVHSNYNSFKNFLDNWGASQKAGFSYLRQTNTYRFLERIAVRAPFHNQKDEAPKTGQDTETLSAAVVENYLQNIDIVNLLARQYGFRAIFAWYPNLAIGHKELTPSEQQVLNMEYQKFPGLGSMYQATYKRGREVKRPDFYYLGDLLDEQKSSLYVGISHLKPEGNQIVADRLFDILEHPGLPSANVSGPVSDIRGK